MTARRLITERGLAGFTVEELCESVGVSRRTFFNYFASKEDAVLGLPVHHDHGEVEERFVAGGGGGGGAGDGAVSPTLVEDLAELLIDRWEIMAPTRGDARELMAAFEREPRLLSRVLELTRTREHGDITLVQRREHLPPAISAPLRSSASSAPWCT